jgi:hypothetical protein
MRPGTHAAALGAVFLLAISSSSAHSAGPVVGWGDRLPHALTGEEGTTDQVAIQGPSGCAIQAGSHAVVCWGSDTYGESSPPDSVNGVSGGAKAISASAVHTCAIERATDAVVCWGDYPGYRTTPPPAAVNGIDGTAAAIASGWNFSLAIQVPEPAGGAPTAVALAVVLLIAASRSRRPRFSVVR